VNNNVCMVGICEKACADLTVVVVTCEGGRRTSLGYLGFITTCGLVTSLPPGRHKYLRLHLTARCIVPLVDNLWVIGPLFLLCCRRHRGGHDLSLVCV
jgi:hypothetical protein